MASGLGKPVDPTDSAGTVIWEESMPVFWEESMPVFWMAMFHFQNYKPFAYWWFIIILSWFISWQIVNLGFWHQYVTWIIK